jgi:hypothetical protein
MKLGRILTLILLATLLISACSGVAGTTQETPAQPAQEYPYPGQGEELAPQPPPTFAGGNPYPELNDGDEIPWPQAIGMIMTGMVTNVVQTHDMKVMVTIQDGRTFMTLEPAIDEVMRVIEQCGDPCKNITVATE